MALYTPKGYCEVSDVENYTLTEIEASFEENVSHWIAMIENYIDRVTGRNFIADSSASVRYFDGNGLRTFKIDECVEITGLVIKDIDGTTVYSLTEGTEFYGEPYNERPYRRLSINPSNSSYFVAGKRNVGLTAKWGYSVAVPREIRFVAMILVAGVVNYGNNAQGEVLSENIGDYSVTYKDKNDWGEFKRAMEILSSYTKRDEF